MGARLLEFNMEENVNDSFKVTLESLYTNKISEISYDEEETLQEKPTLSQRLTELAQRIDFSTKVESDGSEPAPKRSAHRWPWELANSKLRQALTEISVLSDMIQITQHQQKYVALDPVVASPSGSASPAYQYVVKKRALGLAAEILQKGAASLSLSSTDKEKEFHKALCSLRQRWRLKRAGSGAIMGDLSYRSAGSIYAGSVFFNVSKSKPKESDTAIGVSVESTSNIINVTIPRELRGASEILVFLSPQPVQKIPHFSTFPLPMPLSQVSQIRGCTLSSELQLITAQNVLFNQELFSQLAREAYDQKPFLQHDVFTNRINVPLSMDYWLSIVYIREYDDASSVSSASSFPSPRWDLVVALKQLLCTSHRQRASLVKPRPSTAGFQEQPELRNAGIVPLKGHELKQLDSRQNIFNQFIDKVKHVYNEERLEQWLKELTVSSVDPSLKVVWGPDSSFTCTTVHLVLTNSLDTPNSPRFSVKLVLRVERVTVERAKECGGDIEFPLQREKLMGILKHQVVYQQMKAASELAEQHQWHVLQKLPHPLLSSTFAKSQEKYLEASNLLLEAKDGHRRMDILFHWNTASISFSNQTASVDVGGATVDKWETKKIQVQELAGSNFREKFSSLLTHS